MTLVQVREPPVLLLKKTDVLETGSVPGVTLNVTTTGTSFPLSVIELGVAKNPLTVGPVAALAESLKKFTTIKKLKI